MAKFPKELVQQEEQYNSWVKENGEFLKRFILENFTIQKTPLYKLGHIDLPKL